MLGLNKRVKKPWGWYLVLAEATAYKVKHLHINPHSRTSLQSHDHRKELWVVVQGVLTARRGADILTLGPGGTLEISYHTMHRIENNGDDSLVIVETQYGDCREDDIHRFEDDYGRIKA